MTKTVQIDLFPGEEKPNSTVFVLGATGSGKTALMANLLRQRPRFLILDTRDEYPESFFSDKGPIATVRTMTELVDAFNVPHERIIFRVPPTYDDPDAPINQALYLLIEYQRRNASKLPPITVGLDELGKYATSHSCASSLVEIINRGRGYKIFKVFGAQWFNGLPTWTRDSFTEIYVYRHSEPRGLSMLENYGFNSAEVSSLPQYEALHLQGGVVERIKLIGRKTD